MKIIKWAKLNPEIKFIVGGPVIQSVTFDNKFSPTFEEFIGGIKNLKLFKGSVEDYFGLENFSINWDINTDQIKNNFKNHKELLFSYTIENSCYWKKCKFCHYPLVGNRKRKNFALDLKKILSLGFDEKIRIRLNTPSLSNYHIKNFLPHLPNKKGIEFDFLVRCDKSIYQNLDKLFLSYNDRPPMIVRLGIEFPSDRILNFLRKGFTVNDIYNMLNILIKNNQKVSSTFIIGLPNIKSSDLKNLEKFSKKYEKVFSHIAVYRLFCPVGTKIHDIFIDKKNPPSFDGSFYKGYYPKLTSEEIKLNREAIPLLQNTAKTSTIDEKLKMEKYLDEILTEIRIKKNG
jgi:tRNA A37 methylthiotransferase MiaB